MPASDQVRFIDGRLHETEVFGEAQTRFPFLANDPSDRHARIHTRKYFVDPRRYVPRLSTRTSYTNLLSSSDAFDSAVWTGQAAVTRTADNVANPWDGSTSVDRLLETSDNAAHIPAARAYTFTAASSHCLWAIIAPVGARRYARLRTNDGTSNFDAVFDLVAGQVKSTAGSGVLATIRRLEDGFFLIALIFTPLAASGNVYLHGSTDGSTFSYAGDTAKGFYLAQMQLEQASAPGPLIVTTNGARTVLSPERDPDDIFAYLITEADQVEFKGGLSTVQREFARIPRRQIVVPGSRYVTKPDYTVETTNPYDPSGGVDSGQVAYFSPYSSTFSNRAYRSDSGIYTSGDGRLYSNVKAITGTLVGYATAGTFTLSYKSSTTGALNYNDNTATISAALNALSDVIADGLLFNAVSYLNSSTAGILVLAIYNGGTTTSPVTMNAGGLTVNTSANPITQVQSNVQQTICLPTKLSITSHGLNTAYALAALWTSGGADAYVYEPGQWGSIDSNNIWVPNRGSNVFSGSYAGTYDTTYTPPTPGPSASYVGGFRLTRLRQLLDYYLPGVSAGIASPQDITPPDGLQNPNDFLSALLAGVTGYQTFESDGPFPWMGTMYQLTITQYNFTDLV